MSGLFASGVLISLPGRGLAQTTPPASVFSLEALDVANLSPALGRAVALVAAFAPPGEPRLAVARPEMFAEGETRAWLARAIGGVRDHVALSDGETVSLVPGLRNHVYFYDLGETGSLDALARLERRAPELFAQIDTQFNTALRFHLRGRRFAPQTQALVADPTESSSPLRALALDRHALADSAAAALAAAPLTPGGFAQLHYLRFSRSALNEQKIARRANGLVAAALTDPSRAVVLILPPGGEAPDRLLALLRSLDAGGRLPVGRMPNVFFASEDLSLPDLTTLAPRRTLAVDDFADFSRLAPDFCDTFQEIVVHARPGRHMPPQFRDLVGMVYGPQARIDWLRPHSDASRR